LPIIATHHDGLQCILIRLIHDHMPVHRAI
jgi:hypothetical protein